MGLWVGLPSGGMPSLQAGDEVKMVIGVGSSPTCGGSVVWGMGGWGLPWGRIGMVIWVGVVILGPDWGMVAMWMGLWLCIASWVGVLGRSRGMGVGIVGGWIGVGGV